MEFLRPFGYSHHQTRVDHNLFLAVRHVDIDYLASAKLDDLLDIETWVSECKNSSLTMRQVIRRGDTILVEASIVIVAVSATSGRAVRIPPQLRQIFKQ